MIQAVRDLLPFFVAFYLLDALRHLSVSACLLVARFPTGFRLKSSGLRLGALLPADREFLLSELPIPFTPQEVFFPRSSEATGAVLYERRSFDRLTYAELSSVGVEHRAVLVDGVERFKLPSAGHARTLVERLLDLRDLPKDERGDRLREVLDRSLGLEAVADHYAAAEGAVCVLTWLAWLLFAGLFLALPAAAYFGPAAPALPWVLFWVAGLHLAVVAAAGLAARRLGGRVGRGAWAVLWTAALFPPSVVRVASSLLRNALCEFDHLAVMAALLPRQTVLQRAARELHCARFAVESKGEESWKTYWQSRQDALGKLLEAVGSSAAEALAPPARRDPTADSYCPLCSGEYRLPASSCDSCLIRLVPFDAES